MFHRGGHTVPHSSAGRGVLLVWCGGPAAAAAAAGKDAAPSRALCSYCSCGLAGSQGIILGETLAVSGVHAQCGTRATPVEVIVAPDSDSPAIIIFFIFALLSHTLAPALTLIQIQIQPH